MKTTTLDSLFDFSQGNGFSFQDMPSGDIAFVARGSTNNGISGFVGRNPLVQPFSPGKITVAMSGSVLESFYQPFEFYTSYHVMVLTPFSQMSEVELLTYCALIRVNKYRYSYGRQANKTLAGISVPEAAEVKALAKRIGNNLRSSENEILNIFRKIL